MKQRVKKNIPTVCEEITETMKQRATGKKPLTSFSANHDQNKDEDDGCDYSCSKQRMRTEGQVLPKRNTRTFQTDEIPTGQWFEKRKKSINITM